MNRAFGGDGDVGEPTDQALADLTGATTGVFALHVQDKVLHLKRELMSIAIGAAASVSAPERRIPDSDRRSCSRFCGKFRTPCRARSSARQLAGEPQTADVHPSPNTPSKASLPPSKKGKKCNLCVRYDLSPMSQVAHSGETVLARHVRP